MNASQNGKSCSTSCQGGKCETVCKICQNGKCRITKEPGRGSGGGGGGGGSRGGGSMGGTPGGDPEEGLGGAPASSGHGSKAAFK